MGDKVLSSPSHIHTRASEIISETLWDNGFGKTIHAQADESIVLDNLNRYIYPGSILDGASVANQDYKTIGNGFDASERYRATISFRTL